MKRETNLPDETTDAPRLGRRSILFRTAMLSWIVIILTLGLFLVLIIPIQKHTLIDSMESKAEVIATSIEELTITSIVAEDYSSVVDHCSKVVNERPSVLYLVITRKDGFSLVHTARQWSRKQLSGHWNPSPEDADRVRFIESELIGEAVFHYSYPIDHPGIDWGWIHIGLSLKKYNDDLRSVYVRTVLLAGICILAGFSVSFIFARRLSRPILLLNGITRRVALGDLTAKAEISTGDEVENLAESFNRMTEALRQARDELEIRVEERTVELSKSNRLLKQEIAERRRAEEERAKLEEQLRQSQKMEAIGQLTAGIAHNFNNILVTIMGNLELAIMDSPAGIRHSLERAIGGCQKAADMIKELMLFSRKTDIERTAIDLYSTVDDAVEICRKTFDRKIEIIVKSDGSLPPIMGDPVQLQQILLNLLINSRDALEKAAETGKFPRIEIGVEAVHLEAEDCASRPEAAPGHYVRASVSDNGPGMDEYTQKHIFEPFFTTKEVGKGTGLGLATVYGIVQQHDGWIEVDSRPNAGTTFALYLPVAEEERIARTEEADEELPDGTETILVIDDEEDVQNTLSVTLEAYGYTVLLAGDGEEGLSVFKREHDSIDLIFLDLSMPRMSGREVLAEMLAHDPEVKVIIFTGYKADSTGITGARATVQKPFRGRTLLQTVRKVLDT